MKKSLFLVLVLMLIVSCGPHKTIAYSKSDPVCIASELDGSYTLRVEGRGRNTIAAYEEAGKQAVYAVLFTDVSWPDGPSKRIDPIFHMKQRGYEENKDYFNTFFQDGGEYTKFISMKEKRNLTNLYIRTNAQTVCRTTVSVFVSQLRQHLIEDGILK